MSSYHTKKLIRREPGTDISGYSPLVSRLLSSRGVQTPGQLDHSLKGLTPPGQLKGVNDAAEIVCHAIEADSRILIVGDFDADGATSCALLVSALSDLGARQVGYLVPDRFKYGYGLTREIVEEAQQSQPDLIITVDNGISSIEGVAFANSLGISVVVTDHHLPGDVLPEAAAIVNPNQPGCSFPSKHLAGVGVAFYLLSVVRSTLRERGWFSERVEPVLAGYLDLVALGTIADVVVLDQNNRRLVSEGVRRIRAGRARPGLLALLELAGADYRYITSRDLAFSVAPRVNAAGRLSNIAIGIECLLASGERAHELAAQLDEINSERKEIEADMRMQAEAHVEGLALNTEENIGLCLFDPSWHQGVVGIVASRIKDKTHRPVIAFADAGDGELKGSARSVQGFHVRDALDAIAARNPGLLAKFGGHAMAAGLTLSRDKLEAFGKAFDEEARRVLTKEQLENVVVSDGPLPEAISLSVAREIQEAAPWGQGFPEPVFDGEFKIADQRIVGGRHLKLLLDEGRGPLVDAIFFSYGSLVEGHSIRCAYRLDINHYRGTFKPQLIIEALV